MNVPLPWVNPCGPYSMFEPEVEVPLVQDTFTDVGVGLDVERDVGIAQTCGLLLSRQ